MKLPAFCVGLLAACAFAQCPPVSSDGVFAGWTSVAISSVPVTNPWSAVAIAGGGVGGSPSFSVTQSVIGGVVGAGIFLAHVEPVARPLPLSGFGSIDLSVQASMIAQTPGGAFGGVVAMIFCVEQGGVVYYAPTTYSLVFLNAGFGLRSANGLNAASFTNGGTPALSPDFMNGGPVRFGFTTGNGNGGGGSFGPAGMGTTTTRFDDFTVGFESAASSQTTVAGSGVASPPLLTVGAPILGTTVVMSLTNLPPLTTGSIFVSHAPAAPTSIGLGYVVGLEFATLLEFMPFGADAAGGFNLSVFVPNICGLSGFDLTFQAVAVDPAGVAGFTLSNAVATIAGV